MKDFTLSQPTECYDSEFLHDTLQGLSHPQKCLPSKYFYDAYGSQLFTDICTLKEYYVTRTETALLERVKGDIARLLGPHVHVIEPGAGASDKVQVLMAHLSAPQQLTLTDISAEILQAAGKRLEQCFPGLPVNTVVGDFTRLHALPSPALAPTRGRQVVYFPGSTIGNFSPIEAGRLLSMFGSWVGEKGLLLIGVDQIKSTPLLERAYNDDQGVTAAFNLNLLSRINRELEGTFDLGQFRHHAFFNEEQSRIEMHLISTRAQTVQVAGQPFAFTQGESIHTENSYKYTPEGFIQMARAADWYPIKHWHDAARWFGLHLMEYRPSSTVR